MRRLLDEPELSSLASVYRRPAGQQLTAQALSPLAVPVGDRCGGRRFVPEMIEASMAFRAGRLEIRRPAGLGLVYGPYIGVACPQAGSTRCDRIGFDVVLRRRAEAVSATVAGRQIRLTSTGHIAHNTKAKERDWGGHLRKVGLERHGSPFQIPTNGRSRGLWGRAAARLPVGPDRRYLP